VIPYGRQWVSQDDIDAVAAVLRSDFLTQGPAVPRFEQALAEYCGVGHAVAVNSATSALHVACMALDLGPGDWLWTSPNTFVASANCARYCGASVDFVDIDPITYNLSISALTAKLEHAARERRLPKVLVPVHFSGRPCEMDAIWNLAEKYRFAVIEDASHAVGASYRGRRVGNYGQSAFTIFSFHPVKLITSAEGGMLMTSNAALAERARLLRSHGITRDPRRLSADHGGWYYEQLELGYNYRLTDLHAALGASQLKRLDEFVARRKALVARYRELLTDLPLILPAADNHCDSAWHLYVIQLREHDRRVVYDRLRAAGIGVNVHYIPVHLQPYYRELGFGDGAFPQSELYYSRALSLPMYPAMSEQDQDRVVAALRVAIGASA
jgi:UDP-4-amino-4,6-dideoxy-N-acetyl-beta-L-altrosamine transaminase